MIRLFNTKTSNLQRFVPQDPKNVRMYVCGPTVYALAHIGNARPAVVFDVLYRLLRHTYGEDHVTYASNYTDVDDKIIKKANDTGVSIEDVTRNSIDKYEMDMASLNVLGPTLRPRATKYINQMIEMIQRLLDLNQAYVGTKTQNVYMRLANVPDSVKLEPKRKSAVSRLGMDSSKESEADFVLWKPAKPNEPYWDSPWGPGRPGWHIECSAMIKATLGDTIDIHGGGGDLKFPHHEAESIQSYCANGVELANYWLHNDMVKVNSTKMAKSAMNFVTVSSLNRQYPGETLRYWMLMTHYRSTLEHRDDHDTLSNAHLHMNQIYRLLYTHRDVPQIPDAGLVPDTVKFLEDDLNTSGYLMYLHKQSTLLSHMPLVDPLLLSQLRNSYELVGLGLINPDAWFHNGVDRQLVERLISERTNAKAERNWSLADDLRSQLKQLGVIVEDHSTGPFWYTWIGDVRQK